MCLIVFSWQAHDRYPLVLAANRDEFYHRPAEPAHYWDKPAGTLAGRDRHAGGTWLAVNRRGRVAAVTNYREPGKEKKRAPSRGQLPLDFLESSQTPATFLEGLAAKADAYNGFNLLTFAGDEGAHFSNREGQVNALPPGIHGLSNHLLNTSWPKVEKAKAALKETMRTDEPDPGALLNLLQDRSLAADNDLPDTGVGFIWERALSPVFICTDGYGTRSSTVLLVDREGVVSFYERQYNPLRQDHTEQEFSFQPEKV